MIKEYGTTLLTVLLFTSSALDFPLEKDKNDDKSSLERQSREERSAALNSNAPTLIEAYNAKLTPYRWQMPIGYSSPIYDRFQEFRNEFVHRENPVTCDKEETIELSLGQVEEGDAFNFEVTTPDFNNKIEVKKSVNHDQNTLKSLQSYQGQNPPQRSASMVPPYSCKYTYTIPGGCIYGLILYSVGAQTYGDCNKENVLLTLGNSQTLICHSFDNFQGTYIWSEGLMVQITYNRITPDSDIPSNAPVGAKLIVQGLCFLYDKSNQALVYASETGSNSSLAGSAVLEEQAVADSDSNVKSSTNRTNEDAAISFDTSENSVFNSTLDNDIANTTNLNNSSLFAPIEIAALSINPNDSNSVVDNDNDVSINVTRNENISNGIIEDEKDGEKNLEAVMILVDRINDNKNSVKSEQNIIQNHVIT